MKSIKHMFFLLISLALCQAFMNTIWAADLIPSDLTMSETYHPGIGKTIGKIDNVEGDAIIIHADTQIGYKVAINLHIYQKDTIITQKNGRVNVNLNDGSVFKLAGATKIVINSNIYNPQIKTRSSFLNMSFGKARFLIVKFLNFRDSAFKVRTPTAVAGVRGSDFVIDATADLTMVAAFENTTLEVAGIARPEDNPVLLRNFKRIFVPRGAPPSEPEWISTEDVEEMTKEFLATIETAGAEDSVNLKAAKKAGPILLKNNAVEKIGKADDALLSGHGENVDDLAQANEFERQMESADLTVNDIIQEETIDNIVVPPFPAVPAED